MSIFTFSKNSFEGQKEDEKTILLTRKHWLLLFGPLFLIFFIALLPFIVYFLISSFSWYERISSLFWFLTMALWLVLWNLAFYKIMIYILNTVLVTNKRVIENKQEGLFKHTVNELELEKIQDVSVKTFGILATFLNFGHLEIQTAAAIPKFSFTYLPYPKKIKEIIRKAKENLS